MTEFKPTCFCKGCGYPLDGLSEERCPECGKNFDPENVDTYARTQRMPFSRIALRLLNPLVLLILGWLFHSQSACLFYKVSYLPGPCGIGISHLDHEYIWVVSGVMLLAGLLFLLCKRITGLLLVFCSPGSLYTLIAAFGYFSGAGHVYHPQNGFVDPRIDPMSRLPYRKCDSVLDRDLFYSGYHNDVIHLLAGWFGRAPGTYDGPFPSFDEADSILQDKGEPIDTQRLRNNKISLGSKTWILHPDSVRDVLRIYLQSHELPSIRPQEPPIPASEKSLLVGTILENRCILLRTYYKYSKEPATISGHREKKNKEKRQYYSTQVYYIFLIDTNDGKVFWFYTHHE